MKQKSRAKDAEGLSPSELIDARIQELGDWRGSMLSRLRKLIRRADPDVVEEWKWMGTPVWAHDGGICTGESYKSVVKLTFFKGASLEDPAKLFNSSLDGNVRRAIDIHEGDDVDEKALEALIRAAVTLNTCRAGKGKVASAKAKRAAGKGEQPTETKSKSRSVAASAPLLLAGGNPQIAKADGDAPVNAYIAAMPGWKRDVGPPATE